MEKEIKPSSYTVSYTTASPCGTGKKHSKADTPGCTCGRKLMPLSDLELKWNKKFQPKQWENVVLDEYKQGASDIEIVVILGISRTLFYRLLDDEPKFSDTIEKGRALSESWWTRTGRTELTNKDFSYQGFKINMANRFNWREKQDHTTNDKEIGTIAMVLDKLEKE